MDIKRYTEDEVLEDYRTGMQMVADQLALLVGKQVAAGVAGLTAEQMDDVNPGFSENNHILDLDGANLLRQVHRFAYLGKLSGWLADELNDNAIGRWETMFVGMNKLASANWGGQPFDKCLQTIRVANLRLCLMPETHTYLFAEDGKHFVQGCIHISELAVLSGLEEKTLRNIGSASHKRHLPTLKIGSKTYVALSVALPWLEARGFASTIFDMAPAKRDLGANPFYSKADIAAFIAARRVELNLSDEALQLAVDANAVLLQSLRDLERGETGQEASLLGQLARLLALPVPEEFVDAIENCDVMGSQVTQVN